MITEKMKRGPGRNQTAPGVGAASSEKWSPFSSFTVSPLMAPPIRPNCASANEKDATSSLESRRRRVTTLSVTRVISTGRFCHLALAESNTMEFNSTEVGAVLKYFNIPNASAGDMMFLLYMGCGKNRGLAHATRKCPTTRGRHVSSAAPEIHNTNGAAAIWVFEAP